MKLFDIVIEITVVSFLSHIVARIPGQQIVKELTIEGDPFVLSNSYTRINIDLVHFMRYLITNLLSHFGTIGPKPKLIQ